MVLVRIDLGIRPIAGAAEAAQALLETLVEIARTDSAWSPMKGVALVAEGQFFGNRIRPRRALEVPQRDGTGIFVRRTSPGLVRNLVEQEPDTREVAADVTWQKSLARIPDSAQRCALAVRLLERRLPAPSGTQPVRSGWATNARWWLRAVWARERFLEQLSDAAHEAIYGWDPRDQAAAEHLRRFKGLMLPDGPGGTYGIDRRAILLHLRDVAPHVPAHYMAHRIVHWTSSKTADGVRLAAHLEDCTEQFDQLLWRARRVRNAVLHGNDTVPAVVESVEPFLQGLCHILISQHLHALNQRNTLTQVLADDRDRCLEGFARLRSGETPDRALFDDV